MNNKKLIDKIKRAIVMFMKRVEVCSRQSVQKDEADKVQKTRLNTFVIMCRIEDSKSILD